MEMCDDRDEGTGFYEGRTSTNEAKSTGRNRVAYDEI